MQPLNSGNQDNREQLVSRYLPVLATAVIAIPLLYVVCCLSAAKVGMFFFEWLVFLLLAMGILHGLVTRKNRFLLILGLCANIFLPFAVMLMGVLLRQDPVAVHGLTQAISSTLFKLSDLYHGAYAAHGLALAIANAFAWVPGLITLDAAGGALQQIHQDTLAVPRKTVAFSRILILLIMLIGTMMFMQGEIFTSMYTFLPNPLFFALPFYLVIWVLLSLAKLVHKAYETPQQPIIFSGNLIAHWFMLMLVVLLCSTGLALLLPKNPIRVQVERNWRYDATAAPPSSPPAIPYYASHIVNAPPPTKSNTHALRHDYHLRQTTATTTDSTAAPRSHWQQALAGNTQPAGSHARTRNAGGQPTQVSNDGGQPIPQGSGQGAGSGAPQKSAAPAEPPAAQSPPQNLAQHMENASLDLLIRMAKTGEGTTDKLASQSQMPVKSNATTEDNATDEQPSLAQDAASSPHSPPAPKDPVKAKLDHLRALLREHPIRLWKIIFITGLLLISLLMLFLAWRMKWLHRLWHVLRAKFTSLFLRFYQSAEENNREQMIAQLMSEYDPFADPFLATGDRPPRQLVRAVYQTFLAYLTLMGLQRKVAQTEFDFALWLQKATPLNRHAVWTITHLCTSAQYAQAPPTSEELTLLQEALQLVIGEVLQRVPVAEVEPRKERYRYLYAESIYDARMAIANEQDASILQPSNT